MANAHRGEAELKAGDATYLLVFDINAICDAEDHADKPIADIMAGLGRISTLRLLLRSAMQKHHAGATIEQAGEVIGAAGVPATMAAITKALNLAFPKPKKGDTENPL